MRPSGFLPAGSEADAGVVGGDSRLQLQVRNVVDAKSPTALLDDLAGYHVDSVEWYLGRGVGQGCEGVHASGQEVVSAQSAADGPGDLFRRACENVFPGQLVTGSIGDRAVAFPGGFADCFCHGELAVDDSARL